MIYDEFFFYFQTQTIFLISYRAYFQLGFNKKATKISKSQPNPIKKFAHS